MTATDAFACAEKMVVISRCVIVECFEGFES